MDLYHHDNPPFTRWIIECGLLHETFVVIDVGVQGGEHPRWSLLGDHVRVYGFDPISEAIDRLQREARRNRVYRTLALGNEDREREFYVPANTFGASFFNDGSRREADQRHGDGAPGPRTVPVARLDTLFAAGEVPPADFVKLDTEQFELEVLHGARAYLRQSNILGLIAEASFRSTKTFPRSPLPDIMTLAAEHRLSVFDLSYVRHPRADYIDARTRAPWPAADPLHDMPPLDIGQPETVDLLMCRDFVAEATSPELFPVLSGAVTAPTVDKIIKAMILFELHGLMDCAVELARYFRRMLLQRLDVEAGVAHLIKRPPYARNTADMVECLRMLAAVRSLKK
jgi:FkbM family methyltransferase